MIASPAALLRRLLEADDDRPSASAPAVRALDCCEYEDRTLFSATPAGGDVLPQPAPDANQTAPQAETAVEAQPLDVSSATAVAPSADEQPSPSPPANPTSLEESANQSRDAAVREELVIIDGSVTNYQQLLDDLQTADDGSRRLHVVVLDPNADGIEQISSILAQYDGLSAMHFVTHAADGTLQLGDTRLNQSNFELHAEQIAQWRAALTDDADLLFYGCELAASEQGRALLQSFEQATGADVAASTNNTGSALFGGDWNLEFADGPIETSVAFSAAAQQNWVNLLNVAVDAVSSSGDNGTTSLTITHTTSGSNRLMLVGIAIDPHGDTITSVTYDGVALTRVGREYDGTKHASVEIWALVAPNTGTHDVVINVSGSSYNGMSVGVMTFTGVDQASPLGTFAGASGTGTTASVTVASQTSDVVFGLVSNHKDTTVPTADPGQTEYYSLVSQKASTSGTLEAGAASVTNGWTVANDDWAAGAISIQNANTAPVLDNTATPVLNNVAEDAGAPIGAVGTLVSDLVDFFPPGSGVNNVSDPDAGALLGVAVTAADTINGSWWYSTDGGGSWNALGSVSDSSARLLAADANTRIYFQPTANYNGTVSNAITFRAWDQSYGTNGSLADASTNGGRTAFSTATDTAAITVTAVNDAPTFNAPAAQTVNEDTNLTFSSGNGNLISISDIDAGSGTLQVTLTVTNGTLTLSGTTGISFTTGDGTADASLQFTGTLTDINAALNGMFFTPTANFSGAAGLGLVVNDQGNTGSGGALSDTKGVGITVDPVNDPPVNTVPGPQVTDEDTALVFSSGNGNQISIDDIDAASGAMRVTLTGTNGTITLNGTTGLSFSVGDGTADATMTFTGTITDINTALNGLSFTPTADFNGAATLQIVTNDQGNTGSPGPRSDTDTVSITVNAVNDAPVLDNTGTMTLTSINEDNANPAGNTVASIIASAGGNRITDVDAGAVEGIAITSLTTGNGAWEYSLNGGSSWLSVGAVANNSALLLHDTDLVRFVPDGMNGSTNTITFRAWDQTSGAAGTKVDTSTNGGTTAFSTATETAGITVTSVNDAPVLDNTGTMTLTTITEDDVTNAGDAVFTIISSAGGDRITDVDSGAFEGFAVTGLNSGNGTWQYSTNGGVSWLAVGSVSDSSALLLRDTDRLRFVPDGQNATSADITFRAWDQSSGVAGTKVDASVNGGTTAFSTATGVASITVTAVNDSPVNTVPGPQSTDEDTPLVFSTAGGNPISIADVDADTNPVQVTLTATGGTLTLSGTTGLSFTVGSGTDDATMTFTGTIADINAALDGLSFVPVADYNGPAQIQITTDDQGNVGAGGPLSDTDTIAITVDAVNDAPTIALPGMQTTPFRTSIVFSPSRGNGIVVGDVDAGPSSVGVTLTVTDGTLTLSGTTGLTFTAGSGVNETTMTFSGTLADVNAALDGLTFTPGVVFRGATTISATVDDAGNSGLGGSQTAEGQVTVNVQPAAQRLTLVSPGAQSPHDSPFTFSPAGGNGIQIFDIYNENPILTVTLTAANGIVTLAQTTGLMLLSGGSSGSMLMFSGTLADVNAALDGLSFATAITGEPSLSISASDEPRDGTGSQSVSASIPITQPLIYPSSGIDPTVDPDPQDDDDDAAGSDPSAVEGSRATVSFESRHAERSRQPTTTARLQATAGAARTLDLQLSERLTVRLESPADETGTDLQRLMALREMQKKWTARPTLGTLRSMLLDPTIPWTQISVVVSNPGQEPLTEALFVGTAGFTATLSVGYALWSLRAVSLLSSLLSSMPAWQTFDPLPILAAERERDRRDEEDDEEESSQDLFAPALPHPHSTPH